MKYVRLQFSLVTGVCLAVICLVSATAQAQLVCLPAPRLLTTMPIGGQAGTTFEVTISGEDIEDAD